MYELLLLPLVVPVVYIKYTKFRKQTPEIWNEPVNVLLNTEDKTIILSSKTYISSEQYEFELKQLIEICFDSKKNFFLKSAGIKSVSLQGKEELVRIALI